MTNKPMGDLLYSLLPQIYKKMDAEDNRFHLQRFLQVNGVGLDFLRDKADGYSQMFNLDKTPPELLPHIAKMMGFEYPYDMTEQEQRNMLKLLPTLYKMKGTKTSFNFLAQQIFGIEATAKTDWISRGGVNGENQIKLSITADGELSQLQTRIDRYYKYSEQFRPVNHKLFWLIQLYYNEVYSRQDKASVEYLVDILKIDDDYDPNLMPRLNNGLILTTGGDVFPVLKGDVYNRQALMQELYFLDKLINDEGTDSYPKLTTDTYLYDILKADEGTETLSKINFGDAYLLDHYNIDDSEDIFSKVNLLESYFFDSLRSDDGTETYNKIVDEAFAKDAIVVSAESDNYDKTKIGETFTELVIYDDNREVDTNSYLNTIKLNSGVNLFGLKDEAYDKTKVSETLIETLSDSSEEIYNKGVAFDEEITSTINYTDEETYSAVKDDSSTSITVSLVNALNGAKLNSTMLLSKNPTITTLAY